MASATANMVETKVDVKAEGKPEPKPQRAKALPEKPTTADKAHVVVETKVDVKAEGKPEPKQQRAKALPEKPTTADKAHVAAADKKDSKEVANNKDVSKTSNKTSPDQIKASVSQKISDIEKKSDVKPEKKDSTAKPANVSKDSDTKKLQDDKIPSKKNNEKPTTPTGSVTAKSGNKSEADITVKGDKKNDKAKSHNGSSQSKEEQNKEKKTDNGSGESKEQAKKEQDKQKTHNGSSESKDKTNSTKKPETTVLENNSAKPDKPEKQASEMNDNSANDEKSKAPSEKDTSDKKDTAECGNGGSAESSDKNNNESDEKVKNESEDKKAEEAKTKILSSKFQLRSEMWRKMFRSSLLVFRKPCNYRIPHFKGDVISAGRLSTLEIFQNAKVVKVSLDKAHECVRLQVIEAGKEMIVGCPGLREAVFLHVKPPMEPTKSSNKLASTRIGIGHVGTALEFMSGTQADLVIVCSVAVDRTGLRVGKGEGFADLEYALLKKLGGIAPDAPIVTVVHDSQVYDTLPENLFKEHDVPADYIVTPTEIIEVNPKRKHPELIWNILSNRRVNSIPIVKQLLDKEQNRDGVSVSLKDEDTDSEELEKIARRKRYFMRRRTYSNGNQRGMRQMLNMANEPLGRPRRNTAPSERQFPNRLMSLVRDTRPFRNRTPSLSRQNFQQNMMQNFMMAKNMNGGRRRNRQIYRPKYNVEFSLKVQGLNNDIRVRDLKAAVSQRGIRPRDISWLPHKGLAFLHFSKPKTNSTDQPPLPTNTESILATLKDLTVKAENGPETNLKIEAVQPLRKVHFTV